MAVLGTLLNDLTFQRWVARTYPDEAQDIWEAVKHIAQEAQNDVATHRRSVAREE